MRIWKWTLDVTDLQTLELPKGAQILTVQLQGSAPQLWAICDEDVLEKDRRHIAMYGTGNPMPDQAGQYKYISTVQLYGGQLVSHVFEIK